MILAIARVNRVKEIYTTDDGVRDLALQLDIKAVDLDQLAVPPPEQAALQLEAFSRSIVPIRQIAESVDETTIESDQDQE